MAKEEADEYEGTVKVHRRNTSSATRLIGIGTSVNTGTDQVPPANQTFIFYRVNKNFHGQQRMARKTINMINLEMNCGKN